MPNVHPFPARMAPELVESHLATLPEQSVLLDPMMGSGSFVLQAASRGHRVIGVDSDPLARIITVAAVGDYEQKSLMQSAEAIVRLASSRTEGQPPTQDEETQRFIDFWFDPVAQERLAAIAEGIKSAPEELHDPLWCAFSRLIITKDAGASRARDVSHSRPHRVRALASFDPVERFVASARIVGSRSVGLRNRRMRLITGDARALPLTDGSIDSIMTSPPYLIAIDYLRAHRLSLVWMGYTIKYLRELRARSIGTEVGSDLPYSLHSIMERSISGEMSHRQRRILSTYLLDIEAIVKEQSRVLRPGGSLVYVVANARHRDSSISVESLIDQCASALDLTLIKRSERTLPQQRRYLPPPKAGTAFLDRRMHTEVILEFRKD